MFKKFYISKRVFLVVLFLLFSAALLLSQTENLGWRDFYLKALPDGFDPWCGPVVGVEGDETPVVVTSLDYGNGKSVNIFYPSAASIGEQTPAVLFISGISDASVRREMGRPWMYSNQALGWGRLCAENGIIAVTYENDGRVQSSLSTLAGWLKNNGSTFGIDTDRLGTWSCSDQCAAAVKAFRSGYNALDGIRPFFGVFYYGNVLLKEEHDPSIPLMIVRVANDTYADGQKMESFVERLRERGGNVLFLTHETGSHAFDVKGDSEETRAIMAQTLQFMMNPGL